MKTARLIKRNEMSDTANQPQEPVNASKPAMRPAVRTWIKEKERATPTHARAAFAALFSATAGQMSC